MVFDKNVKYRKFVFQRLIFLLRFVRIVFIASSYDLTFASIILSHLITESCMIFAKYLSLLKLHVMGFQIYFFTLTLCFSHTHQHLLLFHFWFELHFLPSGLHLHLHDKCFFNIFDSFIPVIM